MVRDRGVIPSRPRRPRPALLAAALIVLVGGHVAGQDEGASGWLRSFDATRLAPERPTDHTAGWATSHGTALLTQGGASCTTCHAETWCADCHGAAPAPVAIHAPGYVAFHGFDAMGSVAACTSCHEEQLFCRSCHVQTGWTPEPDVRPLPGVSVHPAGWVEQQHPREATADLARCASCHGEESCASCHRVVSPHGPEFLRDCDRLLDAGAGGCATCHTSSSALPMESVLRHPRCRR